MSPKLPRVKNPSNAHKTHQMLHQKLHCNIFSICFQNIFSDPLSEDKEEWVINGLALPQERDFRELKQVHSTDLDTNPSVE